MKTLRLNSILLFLLAVSANTLLGQSIVKIADVKIVAAGETLTIPAGSIIELGAGAVLQVEGSLVMNGTASNPIRIKNIDVVIIVSVLWFAIVTCVLMSSSLSLLSP